MSLKVKCNGVESSTYPCLKISHSGRIVLFFRRNEGFEVIGLTGPGRYNRWSRRWAEDDEFKLFKGIIELSN